MQADAILLITGALILLASVISLKLGLSIVIIELIVGALAGNLGILQTGDWTTFIATFGGFILTFLARTEIDTKLMREKFKESFLIGAMSFVAPFIGVVLFIYSLAGWNLPASLIAGTALAMISLAVVHSVLVGVVVTSAIIPTYIVQKWFRSFYSEYILALNGSFNDKLEIMTQESLQMVRISEPFQKK